MQTPKVYVPAISPISHRGSSEAQSTMVPTVSLTNATISISNSYRWNTMSVMLLHNWVSPYIHVHTHTYTCAHIKHMFSSCNDFTQSDWLQCLFADILLSPVAANLVFLMPHLTSHLSYTSCGIESNIEYKSMCCDLHSVSLQPHSAS